jgi:ketol-acid reductoisomerase
MASPILEIGLTIIISIIVIYGTHYLWNNIITTYSTKKTKNLVDSQIQKYKKIIDEIQQGNQSSQPTEFISEEEKKNMDESLTDYIMSLGAGT